MGRILSLTPEKNLLTTLSLSPLEGGEANYSRYWCDVAFPETPLNGDIVYREDLKKLYIFEDTWSEIDYMNHIMKTPEYESGYLRFNNGQLQVSLDGSNWYDCYPALGNQNLYVHPTTDLRIFYILPGQSVLFPKHEQIPLVLFKNVCYEVEIFTESPEGHCLIKPADISTSVYVSYYLVKDSGFESWSSVFEGIYIGYSNSRCCCSLSLEVDDGMVCRYVCLTSSITNLYGVMTAGGHLNMSSNLWWVGQIRNSEHQSVLCRSIYVKRFA